MHKMILAAAADQDTVDVFAAAAAAAVSAVLLAGLSAITAEAGG